MDMTYITTLCDAMELLQEDMHNGLISGNSYVYALDVLHDLLDRYYFEVYQRNEVAKYSH